MGTGTNQIATLGDVNRLRKKSVVTNATTIDKLATKAEVSNIEGLYINSSYDNNQCVKYSDLKRSNISFKAYFGVWNCLGSGIKNLKIEAAISTDTTSNTWKSIGSTTIDIKSDFKHAASFTCTIPSTIDLSKTYYLSVYCGSISKSKSWSTKIAKNDAATMEAPGYTYVGEAKAARIYFGELVDILSSPVAGSNNNLRTENKAALFRIQS